MQTQIANEKLISGTRLELACCKILTSSTGPPASVSKSVTAMVVVELVKDKIAKSHITFEIDCHDSLSGLLTFNFL